MYVSGPPDWTAIVSAVSSALLVLGVFFGAFQFLWQRKADRVVETGRLIDYWEEEEAEKIRSQLDWSPSLEECRRRALELFIQYKTSGEEGFDFDEVIQRSSTRAERMEVYIRKGAANEAIIAEIAGYEILATYYILHNILQWFAAMENIDYEGWRDLALRIQHYARIHPQITGFPEELLAAPIPLLHYKDGTHSEGYIDGLRGLWRLIELGFIGYSYNLRLRKEPQIAIADLLELENQLAKIPRSETRNQSIH